MKKLIILSPFIFLLLPLNIYAVGISSPYLEDNTLQLIRGESTTYSINLQNTEDTDIDIEIIYSSKIAKIIDYKEVYTLPAGTLKTKISFDITASRETKIGDIYTVSYSVNPLAPSGEGTLPMIVGINKKFNVEIIKDPNSKDTPILFYAAPIIAVIALIIFIWRKIKKRRP